MDIDINELLNKQDETIREGEVDVESLLESKFSLERAEVSRKTLVDMRRRIAQGDEVPAEELAEALSLIREMYGREALATVAKAKADSKKKAKKKPAKKAPKKKMDKAAVDDLLSGLLGGL